MSRLCSVESLENAFLKAINPQGIEKGLTKTLQIVMQRFIIPLIKF